MTRRNLFAFIAGAFLLCTTLLADAPLKSALGLSIDQAKAVDEIQAKHRKLFAVKRQERNRELRVYRRAKVANDAETMAKQEAIAKELQEEMRQIRASEDDAIRKLLNAEQRVRFEEYIERRKAMVGSSRDEADLKD